MRWAFDLEIPNSSAASRTLTPSLNNSAAQERSAFSMGRTVHTGVPVEPACSFTSKGFAASPINERHFSKCNSQRKPSLGE